MLLIKLFFVFIPILMTLGEVCSALIFANNSLLDDPALKITYIPLIVWFMSQPSFAQFWFQISQITPSFVTFQPWMKQRFFHGMSFSTLDLQEISNQVYGLAANFFPWMWRIHKCSVLDLFINIFVFVERECTRQTHLLKKKNQFMQKNAWNHRALLSL